MSSKTCGNSSQPTKLRCTIWRWVFIDSIRHTIKRCNLCIAIKQERKILARLSDAELRDIGVHRADAIAESRRSMLDIPEDRMNGYDEQDDKLYRIAG